MTFRENINLYDGMDNPFGDFAHDFKKDNKIPTNIDNQELFDYLSNRVCGTDAHETFQDLVNEYEKLTGTIFIT
jgi:YozE SAM-like fold